MKQMRKKIQRKKQQHKQNFQKEWKKFESMKAKEKELGGGSYFSSLGVMNRKKLDTLYKKMDTNDMYAELKMRGVEC